MANKQCPVCKMEVDADAANCPGCNAVFDNSPTGATAAEEDNGEEENGEEENGEEDATEPNAATSKKKKKKKAKAKA